MLLEATTNVTQQFGGLLHRDLQSSVSREPDPLIESAKQGDANALNQLFAPCLPQLQRTAARLLGNPHDCEDALQDGLLSALRYLDKFEGRAKFSTWMQTIVMNAAKSILRKRRRQPITLSLDEPHPEHQDLCLSDMIADPRDGLEEEYAQFERSRILATILDVLPPASRSVIWLCDVEGLCMKDAAEWLGVSVSAVKTRHLRANRLVLKVARECSAGVQLGSACQSAARHFAVPPAPEATKHVCRRSRSRSKRHVVRSSFERNESLTAGSKRQESKVAAMVS